MNVFLRFAAWSVPAQLAFLLAACGGVPVDAELSSDTSWEEQADVDQELTASSLTAPTALAATVVGDNKVELSWKPASGTGTITYSIYRSTTSGSGRALIKEGLTARRYVDGTVSKGTKYYYIVRANNGSVTSAHSNEASVFVSWAKMLFKTSFGPGVKLSAPTDISPSQAWQYITGTDTQTGYTFPVSGLGSNATKLQLIGPYGVGGTALTASNVNSFFGNAIQSVVGPKGNNVNALLLNLKIKEEPVGGARSQIPFLIQRPWTIPDTGDVYISYWHKFPADIASKLDATVSSGNWRLLFEWKTGGWNNTYRGDYRMQTVVLKGTDGVLYWNSAWDNNANLTSAEVPTWTKKTYWSEANRTVPVPVGKWFKFEVFWHRSAGADGRYWAAVDGKKIADHYGPNIGDFKLPVTRIFVDNAYSGGLGPVQGHLTDLHIWNGFPCGNGISCP